MYACLHTLSYLVYNIFLYYFNNEISFYESDLLQLYINIRWQEDIKNYAFHACKNDTFVWWNRLARLCVAGKIYDPFVGVRFNLRDIAKIATGSLPREIVNCNHFPGFMFITWLIYCSIYCSFCHKFLCD